MNIQNIKRLIYAYGFLLALLPFVWWPARHYLLGGDDIKYEYVDPAMKLSALLDGHLPQLSGNESAVIHEVSGFPFYLLLAGLRKALPFLNTQQLVNALVLSGSFLGFFWMTSVLPLVRQAEGKIPLLARFTAANVYALSGFNIVTMWSHQLPAYVYMATLPLMVGFFIRGVISGSKTDGVVAALILVLSPAPYGSAPWLIPVAICGFPLVVALALERPRDTLLTAFTFFLTAAALFFPVWIAMAEFRGYSQAMFDPDAVTSGINAFRTQNMTNSLFYPLALTPHQWLLGYLPFSQAWLFKAHVNLFSVVMVSLAVGAAMVPRLPAHRKHGKILAGVLLSWGLSVILYTGGGIEILLDLLLACMRAFPFLSMFRNNYDKFSMAISLFSGLMLAYSLVLIASLRHENEA